MTLFKGKIVTSNDRGYKGHGLNHLDQEVDGSMVRINGFIPPTDKWGIFEFITHFLGHPRRGGITPLIGLQNLRLDTVKEEGFHKYFHCPRKWMDQWLGSIGSFTYL